MKKAITPLLVIVHVTVWFAYNSGFYLSEGLVTGRGRRPFWVLVRSTVFLGLCCLRLGASLRFRTVWQTLLTKV